MSRPLAPTAVALCLFGALCLTTTPAQAQGPTYQDTTGLTWSVATLEAGLMLSAVGVAVSDAQSATAVAMLGLILTAAGAAVAAGVGQATNAPVEPPMVFHQGIIGGALLGGLLSFSLRAAGERGDTPTWVGLAGLLAGAAGAATYSVLRMERLAHDPQLLEEAHVLSWAPVLGAGLVTALLTAVGLQDGAGVIGATVGLIGLGIAISLVEVAIAEHPPPEPPMEMTSPLVAF